MERVWARTIFILVLAALTHYIIASIYNQNRKVQLVILLEDRVFISVRENCIAVSLLKTDSALRSLAFKLNMDRLRLYTKLKHIIAN